MKLQEIVKGADGTFSSYVVTTPDWQANLQDAFPSWFKSQLDSI
jgi:hypothetical protein